MAMKGLLNTLEDASGETALMRAVREKNLALIEKLLLHGADPNLQDKNGKTALIMAIEDIANPNIPDKLGKTLALARSWSGTIALPLAIPVKDRATEAIRIEEAIQIVRKLVSAGADPDIKDNDGKTASDFTSNKAILDMLEDASKKKNKALTKTITINGLISHEK